MLEPEFKVGDTVYYEREIWVDSKCPECNQMVPESDTGYEDVFGKITEIHFEMSRELISMGFEDGCHTYVINGLRVLEAQCSTVERGLKYIAIKNGLDEEYFPDYKRAEE